MRITSFFLVALLVACTSSDDHDKSNLDTPEEGFLGENAFEVLDFEPNIDSVWYHNIYRIRGNRLLGIAQPINASRKGIRLQILELQQDSSLTLISESAGAFDSYVYLPSFFDVGEEVIMLVNTGYQDTWGNRIVKLMNNGFEELGFIDAGIAIRTTEPNEYDGLFFKFENISECAEFSDNGKEISFSCDSLVLFDDGKGNINQIIAGEDIKYILKNGVYSLETNFKESS